MEIMELARELGNMLKKTDIMKRAQAAEAAFQADSALQTDISEYNAQQQGYIVDRRRSIPYCDKGTN